LGERQFSGYFADANADKELTGLALLRRLENRLDNVIYSLGFAGSRREARHLVTHGHYMINGKKVNLPGYQVRKGDVIEVRESSRQMNKIMAAAQSVSRRQIPAWLDVDHGAFKGTVKDVPNREDVTFAVEENMIVEYYSR
jgi:small subunit ribosomal protein S4